MKYFPWVVVALHSILVLGIATIVGIYQGETILLWNLLVLADYPLVFMLEQITKDQSLVFFQDHRLQHTVGYAIVFLVIGGVQYYFLAILLRPLLAKLACRIQFNLQQLLLVVTVFCIVLGLVFYLA